MKTGPCWSCGAANSPERACAFAHRFFGCVDCEPGHPSEEIDFMGCWICREVVSEEERQQNIRARKAADKAVADERRGDD